MDVVGLDGLRAAQAHVEIASGEAEEKGPKGQIKPGAIEEKMSPGILDEAQVIATVRKRLPAIRNCYEKGLAHDPALTGKLSVQFTIGTSGRVTASKAVTDSLGNPSVTSCVLTKFKGFTFDKPEGGSITFVYPLMFKPGG
jgi:hypothetical protein